MVAAALVFSPLLAGCGHGQLLGPDPFTATTLDGVTMDLAMPTIGGAQPYLTLDVSVGGAKAAPMLVDTASPGIRILKTKVNQKKITRTSTPVNVEFVDGTTFDGVEASASFSFGGVQTAGPINFHLITKVSCHSRNPTCAGADGIKAYSQVQPFAGIFGIGLYSAPIYSPLSQLDGGPASSFTIASNAKTKSGTLTLNAIPTDPAATYSLPKWSEPLPNGVPSWASNEANACWSFGPATPTCVATAFDTGAPFTLVNQAVPDSPPVGEVTAPAQLTLFSNQDRQAVWSVTAGDTPGKNKMTITPAAAGEAVNSGSAIFRSLAVTFDSRSGRVLLAPIAGTGSPTVEP